MDDSLHESSQKVTYALIFCKDIDKVTRSGQHIMVIAGRAKPIDNSWVSYSIYDSTGHGHGDQDSRGKDDKTGVGEGVIAIRCDDNGAITAMKWGTTSLKLMQPKIIVGRVKYSM